MVFNPCKKNTCFIRKKSTQKSSQISAENMKARGAWNQLTGGAVMRFSNLTGQRGGAVTLGRIHQPISK